jgi:hypothetical protein
MVQSGRMTERSERGTGRAGPGPRSTFLASVALAGLLERVQYRLRADEGRAWWASNGRDVLNAVALGCGQLGAVDLRLPRTAGACACAGTLVLLLSICQMRSSRARARAGGRSGGAGTRGPVLVAPGAGGAASSSAWVLALAPVTAHRSRPADAPDGPDRGSTSSLIVRGSLPRPVERLGRRGRSRRCAVTTSPRGAGWWDLRGADEDPGVGRRISRPPGPRRGRGLAIRSWDSRRTSPSSPEAPGVGPSRRHVSTRGAGR